MYTEWSVNEKVSLEVAIGASLAGSRSMCAMKHVGVNVAADVLMTLSLIGTRAGLVVAVADDVGLSSSQNEQDSRVWGRFAHLPMLEPCDAQEAYAFVREAFELSERFETAVILRLTTRVCHVKSLVITGEREQRPASGFEKDPERFVMLPSNARKRIPVAFERERRLAKHSAESKLNLLYKGSDKRVGFVTSGPAFLHVREAFPEAPLIKLGMSYPVPIEKIRSLAEQVDKLVVVEELEPLLEGEVRAAGITVHGGKNIFPRTDELAPHVLRPAVARLLGGKLETQGADGASEDRSPGGAAAATTGAAEAVAAGDLFPRPPTLCAACPHLGVFYCLSKLKNLSVTGDIGCYTLGAGPPWTALDTTVCMGASIGMAHGLDKGRGVADAGKSVVGVIGDSTFLHGGMPGLLDIAYNQGNVTILLLNNGTVGMTGGQDHPGSGRDLHGLDAPRVDFRKLVEALGIRPERIREVDPYELPTLFKVLRSELQADEPSVVITNRPCVLIDCYDAHPAYRVDENLCTGCGNCLEIGCPAISVTRRATEVKTNGQETELAFVAIDGSACTGCGLCCTPCGADAIVKTAATSKS